MTQPGNHPSPHLRRFFSFLIGPAGAAVISFGSTFLITYVASPAEFGRASLFILFVNLAVLVSVAGTDQAYVRFFHRAEREGGADRLLRRTLRLSLILPAILVLPLALFARPASRLVFGVSHPEVVALFLVTVAVGVLGRFGSMTLRLRQRAVAYSAATVLRSAVYAAAIVGLALWWTSTFHAMVVAFSLSVFAFAAYSWWQVSRDGADPSPTSTPLDLPALELLRYGAPLVPAALAMWLLESTDKLALRAWATLDDVGVYATAFRLVGPLTILRQGFAAYWAPSALEGFDRDPDDRGVHRRAFNLTCALAVPLGVVTVLAMPLIAGLFAPAYRPAAAVMPFLVFVPIFYVLSEVTVMGVAFQKRTLDHLWITAVTVGVNGLGNAILVPRSGAVGAAVATAIAYAAFFTLRTIAGERAYPVGYGWKRLVGPIFGLAALAAVSSRLTNDAWTLRLGLAAIGLAASVVWYRREWGALVSELRRLRPRSPL